jgi:hypothetical protein
MSVKTEGYNEQAQRLNLEYIQEAGEAIRTRLFPRPTKVRDQYGELVDGPTPYPLPVALSYQPKNGTAYALVFISVRTIQQASLEVNEPNARWLVPAGCHDSDDRPLPGHILVVHPDFSYPFDLSFGNQHFTSYVLEHSGLSEADAVALTALFRAISGVEILDRRRTA